MRPVQRLNHLETGFILCKHACRASDDPGGLQAGRSALWSLPPAASTHRGQPGPGGKLVQQRALCINFYMLHQSAVMGLNFLSCFLDEKKITATNNYFWFQTAKPEIKLKFSRFDAVRV